MNNDGNHDFVFQTVTLVEEGIPGLSFSLFTCAYAIAKFMTTDTLGYYSFDGISEGQYYITIPNLAR